MKDEEAEYGSPFDRAVRGIDFMGAMRELAGIDRYSEIDEEYLD